MEEFPASAQFTYIVKRVFVFFFIRRVNTWLKALETPLVKQHPATARASASLQRPHASPAALSTDHEGAGSLSQFAEVPLP